MKITQAIFAPRVPLISDPGAHTHNTDRLEINLSKLSNDVNFSSP